MKLILITFLSILLTSIVWSQDTVVVLVTLTDKKYNDPIHNVNATITFNDELLYRTSNGKGKFTFKVPRVSQVNFKLSHPQFTGVSEKVNIPRKYLPSDTLLYNFQMEFSMKTQNLDGIVVSAPGVPTEVFGSKRLHVADFEIQNNGDLVLLTYPKRLKKGSELLLYDGKEIQQTFQIPGVAEELIRDYRGNPHVVCKEDIFGIHTGENVIGISTVPKDYYIKYLAPIVDTNKTKMYFSTFNPDYPAFEYFSYDQIDSTYRKIMNIEDELMMELYRAEYKWMDVRTKLWAKNKEIQTGIDAEIWVGANYFTQSIYYKELYAPLFHRNDTLFVFDYYKDKLLKYNDEGEALDSVGIYHHYNPKTTGWQKNLLQDRETGQIYAVYDRAGYTYIGWVNTNTGEISEQVKLEYRYVDKIAVFDNHVYYVYRPFESIQKRYLYRERLPYDFGGSKLFEGETMEVKN